MISTARQSPAMLRESDEKHAPGPGPKPEAKPNQSLHSFFKARAAPNPPLVSAPAPIHAPKVGAEQTADADDNLRPLEVMPRSDSTTDDADACVIASELLSQLHIAIERIPSETPLATVGNPLSEFSKDPSTPVQGPAVGNWEEVLNPMMKRAFGWGEDAMHAAAKGMMQWGQYGLDGFLAFIGYFVMWCGLKGGMFESKVKAILEELEVLPKLQIEHHWHCRTKRLIFMRKYKIMSHYVTEHRNDID